jgi:hypothetical protein
MLTSSVNLAGSVMEKKDTSNSSGRGKGANAAAGQRLECEVSEFSFLLELKHF